MSLHRTLTLTPEFSHAWLPSHPAGLWTNITSEKPSLTIPCMVAIPADILYPITLFIFLHSTCH